ncbi:MAG: alpha-E domain-containing protein [Verrucomicrobia bacterium]|nr:alpha-E domain-containing protein [Verrucomicrobiota bacterium]
MLCRVADSLFWMSRYFERAENNARMLDVNLQLLLDFDPHGLPTTPDQEWRSVIATLDDQEAFGKLRGEATAESVIDYVTFERENPNSILSSVHRARENARSVREQISSEMWERLNELYLFLNDVGARARCQAGPHQFLRHIVDQSHQFIGTTDATMAHGEGWDFIQCGKMIERADRTSRILDIKYHILLPNGERVGGNIDNIQWMAVLRSCSAMEAYLKLYVGEVAPWKVAEFLILNDLFPRSIRFCVQRLDNAIHRITGVDENRFSNEAERLSGKLRSELNYTTTTDIFQTGLHQYLDGTQLRLIEITQALQEEYFDGAYATAELA